MKTDKNAERKVWGKPSVKAITPIKRTAAGAVRRTIEDFFYNPS